ncbi:non-hydrolyzing UDP-N-acetylglucosamine 2-epimerase [Caulobacter mirabilis]|uniref:UDP-N-acetylglucosamine 2-epimerase (Non-hydrolyzing) n=1 Tax=Caulobacter mirabilis TaxID=69666 RepID=A0A2D2AT44_9CAUL|nr:UDP-N-acetylglucosamine 2-epimerase (non-hydrolyzing) [Caulobacter mirabilis]ATQ41135.1 UDP-N-acetylglucosamine 2-epimerase (non-hydrolyzing) [Caulobacter mirabilis]
MSNRSCPKLLTVVGARPQFVKAAVVSRALASRGDVHEVLVHTGQHFDDNMSGVFFRELEIAEPAHQMTVAGGGHGQMTGRMLEQLEAIMVSEKPDGVLVYGDTNSTLAGALAAVKLHIPVLHIEAGMRSFNRRMPEEMNRILADHASDLLLCSTQSALEHLAREGLREKAVHVGDVMFDATLFAIEKSRSVSTVVEQLGLTDRPYAVATVHRAENTDDPERLATIVRYLQATAGGQEVIFPVHPRTRSRLQGLAVSTEGLRLVEPLGYLDLHRLLAGASLVMTDSGGLQKEAYFHRKPCITLRGETEWTETIEAGWNRLWTAPETATERRDIADYGDGKSGELCASIIADFLAKREAARA